MPMTGTKTSPRLCRAALLLKSFVAAAKAGTMVTPFLGFQKPIGFGFRSQLAPTLLLAVDSCHSRLTERGRHTDRSSCFTFQGETGRKKRKSFMDSENPYRSQTRKAPIAAIQASKAPGIAGCVYKEMAAAAVAITAKMA